MEKKEKNILIAVHDERLAELMNHTLKAEGFCTGAASGTYRMFQLLEKKRYELVILDLALPGKDCIEVIRHLQSYEYRKMPVLALSPEAASADVGSFIGGEFNVKAVLAPPVNMPHLAAKVHAALGTPPKTVPAPDRAVEAEISDMFSEAAVLVSGSGLRGCPRVPLRFVPVELTLKGARPRKSRGFMIDYSMSGLAVKTLLRIGIPQAVYVRVNHKGLSFIATGEVRRAQEIKEGAFLYGIEYSGMGEREKHRLREKLESWRGRERPGETHR